MSSSSTNPGTSVVFRAASRRVHPAWIVASATFLILMLSASVRGVFGVLIDPLHDEFGWSRTSIATASTINLIVFGLMGPVAAALLVRFGLRRVTVASLATIAVGALIATLSTRPWHLWFAWGAVMGVGQSCVATVLAATVASLWFVERRAVVSGVLIAAGTAGTLVFLPVNRWLVDRYSWTSVSFVIAAACLLAIPLALLFIVDRPEDAGTVPFGASSAYRREASAESPIRLAWNGLSSSVHSGIFWVLLGTFTVCGVTTSGMVQVHFVDAAGDHGISRSAASGLVVLIGVFDLVGVIASGWLTDRIDPRTLLFCFYGLRSLLVLDSVLAMSDTRMLLVATAALYGMDWVATVPPTVRLANELFPNRGTVVYGWVFAGHQLGGGAAAALTAWARDRTGSFASAFVVGGVLALVAGFACLRIGTAPRPRHPEHLPPVAA
jgi:sugar phosphate permease